MMEQGEVSKPKPRRKLPSGLFISIAAIVVSVCALFISVFEVRIMREQQHAQAWPYVEWLPTFTKSGFTVDVENKGVGPALIRDVEISIDGEPIADYDDFLGEILERDTGIFYSYSTLSKRVLKPGENVTILKVSNEQDVQKIINTEKSVEMKICYCSVYNTCWETTGLESKPVEKCKF